MQLLFFSGKGLNEKNELRELSQQGGEQPEQDTLRGESTTSSILVNSEDFFIMSRTFSIMSVEGIILILKRPFKCCTILNIEHSANKTCVVLLKIMGQEDYCNQYGRE